MNETVESVWQERFTRERQARKEAERILESKSLELYQANEALRLAYEDLEDRVAARTLELADANEKLRREAKLLEEAQKSLRASEAKSRTLAMVASRTFTRSGSLAALSLAWLAAVLEQGGPLAACRRSIQLTRGHLWPMTLTWLSVLAGVLVFVMLNGVFYGVVMVVAGHAGAQTGVLISQVVFTALLSLPVIYVSAVLVSCRAVLTAGGHSPT